MKTKLMMIGALAAACVVQELAAMPTEDEARRAEPVVKKLLAQERAALNSGKMTRSEVAAAAMGLADKAESEAEKLLLMKGACDFYVHAGEFDKAIETLQTIMTKIPDIPYATIVSILESSLRGVPHTRAKDLWAFLDETKSRLRNTDTTHGKKAQSETNIQKFSRLFPGWEVCKDAQEKEKLGFELAYRGQFNVAVLHPVSKEIPAVVSRTLKLSGKNPCLFLKVSSCDYSGEADWVLSVRVNGKEVLPKRLVVKSPISEPWEDIAVPLFAWRGQEVKVEVVVTANGWFCEFAYFKCLEIAEGSGRENLIPEATETVGGYTWSYRVQNGEATIISEKEGKDSCAVSPNPVGSIVIPATLGGAKVTSIGRGALACCQELESVTIPQGVKRIGRVAFFECKKLKSVEIPSSVTEIDWCAFYRCNALASVAIPSDSELKTLENGAFAECFELKSIAIPDGVTRIARHAFLGCFNIKSLTIPATASNIGGEAFRFCANLSSVTMLGEKPDTSVPPVNRSRTSDNIFLDCGKLKEIHVPANAKSWEGMKEWHGIPLVFDREETAEGKKTHGGYTWSYRVKNGEATLVAEKDGKYSCAVSPTPTGKVSIPPTLNYIKVTSIGREAFKNCSGLTSVTIPEGVKGIEWEAFRNCKNLTSVTIPEGVTHIDFCAFTDCGLTSVTLPSSLKTVGWGAFVRCVGLTSVTIPNGVKCIWHDAFNGCSGLKSMVIPDSVTSIGDRAFIGCSELESVKIPAGLASIGKGVFGGCDALKQITVDSGNQALTSIDCVLYSKNRSELVMWPNPPASVVIPKDVTSIRGWAFAACSALVSVTIPEGVTNIGDVVFLRCDGLKSITIPSSVKSIGEHAFERCVELTEVTMRGERPEAPKNLFPGCRKLKSIHVPANAKSWAGMKEWFGIPLVFDGAAESRQEQSRYMIVDLDKAGKDAVSYLDDVPNGGWSDEYRTKKIAFRRIDPGSFEYMPGKTFKITKPFYIGVFEVTQKQYEMVMKENPSVEKGDMRPVGNMCYSGIRGSNKGLEWPKDNAVDDDSYLGKLRKQIGLEFDLPTEVQWEYACRAGTKGDFNVDGVAMVNLGKCKDNGGHNDHHVKVGSFLPNAWGIYDMHGNVWEWCVDRGSDGWTNFDWKTEPKEAETDPKGPAVGASRILRGGSWWHETRNCRSSLRSRDGASRVWNDRGFRLACPADGHPMKLSTDEKLRELKTANGNVGAKGKTKTVSSGKETVDGVKWAYSIIDGQALVDYALASNVTGSITIPSTLGGCPVTSVGRNEFRSGFGWRVFEKCCNMTSVAIPSGVMNIGDSAFFGCSNMVSVAIPASVTNIARCAFSRCDSLSSVVVDEENEKYSSRNGMLCSKDGATLIAGVNGDVSIPPCVKNIEDYAFQGRSGLKSVIVPSSVTSVGISAFSDCRGLKSVAIPTSVKKIGWYAFSGCSGLMSFSVDSDNPSYSARDGMLCSKDGSKLLAGVNGDVTIPQSVKEIGSHAFFNYGGLKSVRIPENVTSIAPGAFRGCDSLTSVMISSSVTSIGAQAFWSCKKLESVTIPSSVIKIERSVFSWCSELKSFTVDPDNPSYSSRNGLLCSKDGSTLVCGVNGDVTIPSSVKNIGDNAFSGCTGLTSVTIPSSVTNIGYQAFDKCEGLTSVAIPSSVKSIGERAFTMCYKIKSVTIPEGVTSIGKYAFAWCKDIESVIIPQGVTSIGECVFASCRGLKSVSIPTSVESIGDNAFYNCSGLTSMTIPSSVNSIGIGAFYDCSALKTVAIPSSVTSIGRKAFGKTQFYDGMTNGMVILGGGVLYGYKGECPSSVTIPSNVTSIGRNAFQGCSGLETLTIPSTVTDIDGQAFVDCPNLKSVRVVRDGKIETMSFDDFFKKWKNVVAQRLKKCDFLLNGRFKKDAKVYLCLFSASWCGPCRAEMPRIAKTYAETLKDDPNIELIHFSWDQDDEKALAWAKEHDVKFPVVKPNGGNPLDLHTRGIPHLFIVKADGTLMEEGHPMKLLTDERLRELK